MKLLFLVKHYQPSIGGVEKHVSELVKVLQKRGLEITIITNQHPSKSLPHYKSQKPKVLPIPKKTFDQKTPTWKWIYKHRSVFKGADIIHMHDIFWWTLPVIDLVIKKPAFITFHGWEGKFPPETKAIIWRKLADKLTSGNIAVGDFIKTWYNTSADIVTYGATNLDGKISINKPQNIVVLGRLEQDNDLKIVIAALQKAKTKNSKLNITFLGDGSLRAEAKKIGNVFGFKKDIAKYLKKADLVMTSSYLSMIESMVSGKQVFSTYSNPLKKEYLETHPQSHNIYIAGDAETMAQQILDYQKLPAKEKKRRLSEAKAWAQEQTWDKLADDYLRLWQSKTDLDLSKYIRGGSS